RLTICGSSDNDIVNVLRENAIEFNIYHEPIEAVKKTPNYGGILFLSNNYPQSRLNIKATVFQIAERKHLQLYIEYPSRVPDLQIGDTTINTHLERGIVSTHEIYGLDSLSLLGVHNNVVIPIKGGQSLIDIGKVAGFD